MLVWMLRSTILLNASSNGMYFINSYLGRIFRSQSIFQNLAHLSNKNLNQIGMNLSFTSSQASFPSQLGLSIPKSSKYLMSISDSRHKLAKWKKMTPEKLDMFTSLEGWVENNILTFLKPVETLWQPQDFLPNPSCPNEEFFKSIKEIREQAEEIPDEYFVCIVGNMITEEALPTYQSAFNRFEGVRDISGTSLSPWAKWTRRWTAEENRHGDLLNKYLYLSGRLDMRQVEKTIQYLIGSGMDTRADSNPYCGLIYTSFQERATFISHGNTACHAKKYGDATLAKICGSVASDEKRHEYAYTKIIDKLFEIDPDTTMLALEDMMRRRITMPALFMFDGQDDNLFNHYSTVAQRLGIYTSKDYVDIVEFFVKRWRVEEVNGLSSDGRKAQDYVCELVGRFKKIEERAREKKKATKDDNDRVMMPFSWIFNKKVII